MEVARPARAADLAECRRLVSDALEAAAAMRGGARLRGGATPASLLERWTAPDTAQLFVGQYEGAVVGMAAAVAEPADGGPPAGRVECCYVEPDARGVGVGTALMEAAVAWCADQGCAEADALALPGDRATKQRLEAAGFTARLLTLSRRLG